MAKQYKAPRGTADVLPEEQPYWDRVYESASRLAGLFGYRRIQTPVFEEAGLFTRGVGEATDIAQKEMYVFEDRGGQEMALRPEGTAPVCRAYIEHGMHNLPQPVRLWYWTPIFRYDRPQAGRYRQHTQFGCEVIGEGDAAVDAEVIELLFRLYEDLGLRDLTLQINSIGDGACRPSYMETLRRYYADKLERVCDDCRARHGRNPLRLLDCKEERCQPVIAGAPTISEHLCDDCREQFARLQALLGEVGIEYRHNPRLVRGLDYYTRAVFEFQPKEEGSQSTVGAGGRYDGLIELLGGRPTPGTGFATGIERIIVNLKRQGLGSGEGPRPRVYVAVQREGGRAAAFRLASELRRNGVSTVVASGERSLKAQMRQADALGAAFAAIIGERELAEGTVTFRRLADGQQETVALADAVGRLTLS
jgi:histidyl-tRNA synthetase